MKAELKSRKRARFIKKCISNVSYIRIICRLKKDKERGKFIIMLRRHLKRSRLEYNGIPLL